MKKIIGVLVMVGIVTINFSFISPETAMAASLTALSDTVGNLTTGAATSHVIKFTTPTGIASGETVILTFDNSTSTTGVLFSDVTVLDDATPITVNAGAPSGANWGFANATPVITFTTGSGTVGASSVITITFNGTNKIVNGSVGTTTLRISGTLGDNDTGVLSIAIITNGVVSVSAEVLGSISFTVSDNTIYFGNLRTAGACFAQGTDPGAVTCPTTTETEAFNLTAGTNAPTGYTMTVQGATLTSGGNTIDALAANTASSPGSEQFGIRINGSGGSGTVSAPYLAAGYAYTGTASTAATIATSTIASATTTYSVRYLANIAALTEAGSYTTSHTYVATGNF